MAQRMIRCPCSEGLLKTNRACASSIRKTAAYLLREMPASRLRVERGFLLLAEAEEQLPPQEEVKQLFRDVEV